MAVPKIDVNFINPFIDGVLETFKIQCALFPRAGKPFVKGHGPTIPIALSAVIALNSAVFNGTIAICFPENVFLDVMAGMLGERSERITQELEDGASELLNIIFGQAKKVLNERGYAIQKAIPSILREGDIHHVTAYTVLVLPFETESGTFHMEIAAE